VFLSKLFQRFLWPFCGISRGYKGSKPKVSASKFFAVRAADGASSDQRGDTFRAIAIWTIMIQSVARVSDFGKRISVKSTVEGDTRGIAVAARRINADRTHMSQAFDQSQHRDRLRSFRHLAQPGKPTLIDVLPADNPAFGAGSPTTKTLPRVVVASW
jgi:hypothetical protein